MIKADNKIEKNWGHNIISKNEKSLPGLKFKFIIDNLEHVREDTKVLEVGCGEGKHLLSILRYKKDLKLFGCDINKTQIENAKKIEKSISYICCDGLNLPYKNEEFGVVYFSDYLEHVSDINKALVEIKRVLKPGGLLIGNIPCEGNALSMYNITYKLLRKRAMKIMKIKEHFKLYSVGSITKALSDAGFYFIKQRYSYHILGNISDFSLFLMLSLSNRLEKNFWSANKFYSGDKNIIKKSITKRLFNFLLGFFNLLSYYESSLLKNKKFFSNGYLFLVIKPSQ